MANIERSDEKPELRSDDRTLLREQAGRFARATGTHASRERKIVDYDSIFAQASNSRVHADEIE